MIKQPVYIVDDIRAVVQAVNAVIPPVYYMHGHPLEIVNRLKEKVKNASHKDKRFPLVALLQDFKEPIGTNPHIHASVSLNILIIMTTKPEYTSEQRYEKVFKPKLYPIYLEFLKQLADSTRFSPSVVELIKHDKWDRLFWGREGLYGNTGNIFDDHVDAIEINNLELEVQPVTCNNILSSF